MGIERSGPTTALEWLRVVGNAVNLSTPAGLAVAAVGGAQLRRGPRGLLLAEGYRLGFPVAGAFTVGNVLITCGVWEQKLLDHPHLLEHEEGHTWQYLYCLGLPFFLAYAACLGYSVLRTGDRAAGNFFERQAGLALGGYPELPVRPLFTNLRRVSGRS